MAIMSMSATRLAARWPRSTSTPKKRRSFRCRIPRRISPIKSAWTKSHNVWTNLWSTDKVAKYDPSADKWTLFELPTRGTESRHISLLERNGQPMRVIVPYERARKVAVLTPRSDAEIQALKTQVNR